MNDYDDLCKIGELSKKAGIPRSTIHYYCKMGLLEPADYSPGGYRLFNARESLKKIREIREVVLSKITLKDLREKLKEKLFVG
ncbi:MerR family DNA-binding transcriptional regulator [Elusimicrobiota bacterium]